MSQRRSELTPRAMIVIYLLAFCMTSAHQLDRVLNWFQDTFPTLATVSGVAYSSGIFQKSGGSWGWEPLARAEQQAFRFFQDLPEVGAVKPALFAQNETLKSDAQADPEQVGAENSSQTENKPGLNQEAAEKAEEPKQPESQSEAGVPQDQSTPKSAKRPHPKRVLIIGDSFIAEGFGPALQRELKKYQGIEVIRKGQYSSGLVGGEGFDWISSLKELIQKHEPDLLVIHMGANDPLDLKDSRGKRIYFGQDNWKEEYAARVKQLLGVAKEKKILTFWVGLPIMGPKSYSVKIAIINSIVSDECSENSGCFFLDTWNALASKEKSFMSHIRTDQGRLVRIRASDDVHLTEAGGAMLTKYFLESASRHVSLDGGSN